MFQNAPLSFTFRTGVFINWICFILFVISTLFSGINRIGGDINQTAARFGQRLRQICRRKNVGAIRQIGIFFTGIEIG